jgi:hypothetical protein
VGYAFQTAQQQICKLAIISKKTKISSEGKAEAKAAQNFERKTTKYWVPLDKVSSI